MSSINTNSSAMLALQSLAATNKALDTTQSRISTGLRVGEASDNAAYWSIATTMRSDNKAFSSVKDALGLGSAKIDTAYTGMNKAIEVVDDIKQKLVSALGASDEDKTKIQAEIGQLQEQLKSTALAANYAGSNLLANDDNATPLQIVASYDRASDGTTTVNRISVDLTNVVLFNSTGAAGGLLDDTMLVDVTGADDTTIEGFLTDVETALSAMATGASSLGAAKTRVDMQTEFVSALKDSIERGVGQLVDADMNAESARLSALQTQQQLGIQALSIANSNSQNILSLFR
ncbi:flagellin [Mesorhizobium sp. J428]|uniref:flagellin N-terminal helical domain-containing protein n=1 Tax=Mesorhizobium sp. J428 TaxID=2898440 RepID=UPI0021513C7A|nr:flagellin [Mesorhizobium sp. J428]MCR5855861.1 flagellin [Mesorhizobium sp. J428]